MNIPHNEWNDTLLEIIRQSRDQLETDTRRALVTQTWIMRLPAFPVDGVPIELRRPPLQTVTKVDYITGGTSQEWDASNYDVDTTREPGLIRPKAGVSYPQADDVWNAVQITFVAGYGDDETAMPGLVTHAMKLQSKIQFGEVEAGPYEHNAYDSLVNRLGFGQYP